jgi:hypothetical protein
MYSLFFFYHIAKLEYYCMSNVLVIKTIVRDYA